MNLCIMQSQYGRFTPGPQERWIYTTQKHFDLAPTLAEQAEALEKLQQRIIAFRREVETAIEIPLKKKRKRSFILNRKRKRPNRFKRPQSGHNNKRRK